MMVSLPACQGDNNATLPPPPPLIDINTIGVRYTDQDLPLSAQYRLQQQRERVDQVRQLLEREENILSDMLEQVIKYRVEHERRKQQEIEEKLVKEAEIEEENKKEKKAKIKTKKKTTNSNTSKKGPPKSYAALVREAILSSKEKKLPLDEIYRWLEENYPFFQGNTANWKNSIRHNLSLHKCFKRVGQVHGTYGQKFWMVDDTHPIARKGEKKFFQKYEFDSFILSETFGRDNIEVRSNEQFEEENTCLGKVNIMEEIVIED